MGAGGVYPLAVSILELSLDCLPTTLPTYFWPWRRPAEGPERATNTVQLVPKTIGLAPL